MKSIPSLVRGQGRLMASFAPQVIAAVDVGSSKTVCLIAEWSPGKKSVDIDTRNGLRILVSAKRFPVESSPVLLQTFKKQSVPYVWRWMLRSVWHGRQSSQCM